MSRSVLATCAICLGSSRGAIASLMVGQGAVWMAVGLAGGTVGLAIVAHSLRDLLYGVEPLDPVALGVAAVVRLACAATALLRATRADPASVMK